MADPLPVQVKVWGEFACFTRPENKVERVSYPLMTPSAARGVLEAIFWKPEFRWQIEEIHVLNPIQYFSILRNEVNSRQSERAARGWATKEDRGYHATEDRAQRHSLILRDVAYIIFAQVVVKPGVQDDPAKFRDQFRRRVERGQCFSTPYLGNREFSAAFGKLTGDEQPVPLSGEFGRMLLDLDYDRDGSGRGTPKFFSALLDDGVLRVPKFGIYEGVTA